MGLSSMCVQKAESQQTASTALKISRNTKLFGAQNQWEGQTWKEFVLHSETKLSTLSCKFKTRKCAIADTQGFLVLLSEDTSANSKFHPATHANEENSVLLIIFLVPGPTAVCIPTPGQLY